MSAEARVRPLLELAPNRPLLGVVLAGCMACAAPSHHAVVPPVEPRDVLVDIIDYDIQLDLDHEAGYIDGQVAIEFAALPGQLARALVLDATELNVFGVRDSFGRDLDFELGTSTLTIELAEPLTEGAVEIVTIEYEAFPRLGIHFVGPTAHDPARPWHIWTQGQPEDTRHWMPVWDQLDERATHTLSLTVDGRLRTMGAGTLVDSSENPRSGRRTDTWRMDTPHVAYLTNFVAGGMGQASLGQLPVPLPVLADAADMSRALDNSSETAAILEFMAELTGRPYPYPKYAQAWVHDYTAGGMENISASTLYAEGLHDPADRPQMRVVDLLAHEAAHQWFGDLITCRGWEEIWLNEGFADWCTARYIGWRDGPEHEAVTLLGWSRAYMAAELRFSKPIVWDAYTDPDQVFDDHAYWGGAVRLHLLRDQLGHAAFDAALREFVERFEGQLVTTADLQWSLELSTGRDLSTFFEEWLLGPGFPRFRARTQTARDGSDPVLVVEQVQADDGWREVFHITVAVAWSRGGTEHVSEMIFKQRTAELQLGGAGELDWVRFDARTAVPGEVHLQQPVEAWTRQLRQASDPVTRLTAAEWFAGNRWLRPPGAAADPRLPEAWPVLAQAARRDPFVDVRVAALAALWDTELAELADLCLELARDPDPRLRALAIGILGARFPGEGLDPILAATGDANASVCYAAVEALVRGRHPEGLRRLLAIAGSTDKVRLARDLVILSTWADDPAVLPFLMRMARRHPQRWVRAAAVDALGGMEGPLAEPVFRQLCTSLGDASHSVRASAAKALAGWGDVRARRHLLARRDIEAHRSVLKAIDAALVTLD